ncbi:MAG: tetraacyldisaccharide 4'-kinase [Vicinamibacterales bacterium]
MSVAGAASAARLHRPVVSVGNLATGGRGKTPVVALVTRLLLEAGERPAILSRGYGRRLREDGVVVVSDGDHLLADLDRSGDEPLMLARALPGARVAVCDVRALAGALAERALGATVHVLDDGFQHRALARTLDLVIVTPGDLADRRMPFGRLRESPAALGRADAVIIDGDLPSERLPGRRVFRLVRHAGALEAVDAAGLEVPPVPPGPVVAVAGIARPERLQATLEAAGWQVSGFLGFGDHHRFRAADLARIADAARAASAAAVVTTMKDAERLRPWRPLPVPVFAQPLTAAVEPADEFREWLLATLQERAA